MEKASQETQGVQGVVQEIQEVQDDVREIQEAAQSSSGRQEEAVIVQQITRRAPTGVSLGTWGNCVGCAIHIRLHWSMIFFLVLVLIGSWISHERSALLSLFNFILYGPLLFLTVLMHEFGHALATSRLGGEVTQIVLWPAGGLTIQGPDHVNACGDLKIAVAGPLVHLPIMVVWIFLGIVCAKVNGGDSDELKDARVTDSASIFFLNLTYWAFVQNLLILLANVVIPIYPFDAGRIIGNVLIMMGLQVSTAAKVTAVIAALIGILFFVTAWFINNEYEKLVNILLGLVIIGSSLSLFAKAHTGTLENDRIFGRPCYNERTDDTEEGPTAAAAVRIDPPVVNEIV